MELNGVLIELLEKNRHAHTLIGGLGGVGNVGLLASREIVREMRMRKVANVYSSYFTYSAFSTIPGIVCKDGIGSLLKDEFYLGGDVLVLTGPYQGTTSEGYYELAERVLDFCEECGVKRVFTLGGYGTGRKVDSPSVYAIANDEKLLEEAKKCGAVEMEEGTVTGISGLLLSLGEQRGMKCICLLGETPGIYPDPKGALSVLEVLCKLTGLKVRGDGLRRQQRMIEAAEKREAKKPREPEISYIG